MKILIIGGGGREHALAWKLAQSEKVSKIFIAPGNRGTAALASCVPLKIHEIEELNHFAMMEEIDLTVVGPELPLTLGITDIFKFSEIKVFGPTQKAAEIEASKVFAKSLMKRYNIPTAESESFDDPKEAKSYIEGIDGPLVVKADGLAAGKGVLLCPKRENALRAVDFIMTEKAFGDAGRSIIVEEFLRGEEASFMVVTDGKHVVALAPSQDHKSIYDGDMGPNTGGMGAYSPVPVITKELKDEIMREIMIPTVKAMADEDRPYKGVLYAGLMIVDGRAKVLEFNCRFGDPEAQPILMRLKTDLVDIIEATLEERLDHIRIEWDPRPAVCVVMSSKGYPGEYEKGKVITGIEEASKMEDVAVFHAGTAFSNNDAVTSGGRVLGVTALGSDINDAIKKTYAAVEKISFDGAYFRKDIGAKAL